MNNEEIRESMTKIRSSVDKEKNVFLDKSRQAQALLGNIHLSDGSAVGKVAKAVNIIKNANENYYIFLTIKLDEINSKVWDCPIEELDYETVEQIYNLICFINEESTIENSFDGILDNTNLGTLAVVNYNPSMKAKEMEYRWKSYFDNMPEFKKKEYQEKKRDDASEQSRYYHERSIWEKACEPIKQKRDEYVRCAIEKIAQDIKEELDNKYNTDSTALKTDIRSLEDDIQKANSELAGLGIFKIRRKPELKKTIADLETKLNDQNLSLRNLSEVYNKEILEVWGKAKELVERTAKSEAEQIYQYPKEPEKPAVVIKNEFEKAKPMREILNLLIKRDAPMTVAEMQEYYMGTKSFNDINKGLQLGIKEGKIEKVYIGKSVYYSLSSSMLEEVHGK